MAERIALFGGSFDPPHRGHIAIARAAADEFRLDRVLFAPAGRQPLKPEGASASFADRLAMTALACESDGRFAVYAVDAPRADGGANYTVNSLRALAAEFPRSTLYNIVGRDSFRELARWREPQALLGLAEWIVVSRPGVPAGDPAGLELTSAQRARVQVLDWVHEDVSATELRRRIAGCEGVAELVPAAVAGYIEARGLYGSCQEQATADPLRG